MKKLFLLLCVGSVLLVSCGKTDTGSGCPYALSAATASAAETDSIQRYLTANTINGAVLHPSGAYYRVNVAGTSGSTPGACSRITAEYTGTFFTGASFGGSDPGVPVPFILGELIAGWQVLLQGVKAGTNIDLFIPPSLGYGSTPRYNPNGTIAIPANSYLRFNLNIYSIQ